MFKLLVILLISYTYIWVLFMGDSVINTVGDLTFHLSKISCLLRNLITSLKTSLFKLLLLLIEPYSK